MVGGTIFRLRTTRLASSAIVVAALGIWASCDRTGVPVASRTPDGSVPIVTPTTANPPYPFEYDAQRQTFKAFLACAREQGVRYEGPFTDSSGDGIYTRLAQGEDASRSLQDKVMADCPQMTVGLFGTPVGAVHIGSFESAAEMFVGCLQHHGVPNYPVLRFTAGDPVARFWSLPFDWSSPRFTAAVTACVDPLQAYLVPG